MIDILFDWVLPALCMALVGWFATGAAIETSRRRSDRHKRNRRAIAIEKLDSDIRELEHHRWIAERSGQPTDRYDREIKMLKSMRGAL